MLMFVITVDNSWHHEDALELLWLEKLEVRLCSLETECQLQLLKQGPYVGYDPGKKENSSRRSSASPALQKEVQQE